ncbi:MAG: ATP-binding cassette domain-containing protein [Rothia sp. (in: high G+C Gram-positive bacteria)]|nr:ATP-binding cassette domain-containing protein [Rothia sp. (in: high G+C Gram-positive bacteria)]
MSSLIIKSINYQYPGSQVNIFDGFSEIFETDKLYRLVGPNGAGKTTLLELIAGLRKPKNGEITLGNYPIMRTDVSYLSSESSLVPELNIEEHLGLIATLWKMTEDNLREFYRDCFELLEMFNLLSRNDTVDNFSLGMKEKLDFLLTISRPSKVILLDEPFGALDLPSLNLAQKVLMEYTKNKVCIIVTHRDEIVSPLVVTEIPIERNV